MTAGDVIGYMGYTGYSKKENANNIDEIHLHFGIQLIFDESQKDGNCEIWINPYQLTRFLKSHQSEAAKKGDNKIITLNPTVHPTIHTALHKQAYYPHTVLLRTHSAVSSPTDSVQTEMPASPRQNRRTARQAANHTTIPLLNLTPD